MPVRYLLPRRARVWYEGHRSTVGYVLLVVYISAVGGWAFNKFDSNDQKITGSRVEQTRQSCRERNEERKLFRESLTAPLVTYFEGQRKQTRELPPAVFVQFDVPKAVALRRIKRVVSGLTAAKRKFAPLNCKARVRAVRDTLD